MTRTGYADMKTHFDKLFTGGYRVYGLEQIRDVYQYAFGSKVYLYDIFSTPLKVGNNSINKMMTLVGPVDDEELKSGIIPCLNDLCCVSIFDKDYLMGLTEDNISEYTMEVYNAMCNIMHADPLYNMSDAYARENPYCAFLKCLPFYFTFHHVKYVEPDLVDKTPAFSTILEKYICSSDEDAEKIMESLNSTRYSADFEDIYSTMTCKNTVELFL